MSDCANPFTMGAACFIRVGGAGEYREKNARTAFLNTRIEFHHAKGFRYSLASLKGASFESLDRELSAPFADGPFIRLGLR